MLARITVVCSAALLAACLELRHEVTLHADGSGTQRLELALTPDLLATARAFAAASQADLRDRAPDDLFREASVARELTAAGLELTDYRTRKERRAEFVEITAKFASFDVLRRSPLSGPRAEWRVEPADADGNLRLLFWPQGEAAHAAAQQQLQAMQRDGVDAAQQSFFERQRQKIAGLDLTLTLHLPGDVVSCGGGWQRLAERSVQVTISAADVQQPADLLRLLAPRYEVVFAGAGCRLLPAAAPK